MSILEQRGREFDVTDSGVVFRETWQLNDEGAGFLPPAVYAFSTIPKKGDACPYFSGAFVSNVTGKESDQNMGFWTITVTYSTSADDEPPTDENADPTLEPPKITRSVELVERVLERDVDGNPVTTYANEKFDPPAMYEVPITVVNWVVNRADFDFAAHEALVGGTNAGEFLGNPAGTIKFAGLSTSGELFRNGHTFEAVTFVFRHDPEGHDLEILHQGTLYNPFGTRNIVEQAVSDTGAPIVVNLGETGLILGENDAPVFKSFTPPPGAVDFAHLDL